MRSDRLSRRHCPFVVLMLGLGLVLAVLPARAQEGCPATTVDSPCGRNLQSQLSRDSLVCPPTYYSIVAYDLTTGHYYTYADGTTFGSWGTLEATDEYRVAGIPPGSPFRFQAELQLAGFVGLRCGHHLGGGVSGALREGISNEASVSAYAVSDRCDPFGCCGGVAQLDTTLRINIEVMVDETFLLTISHRVSATNASAGLAGQLRFSGLPEGATIASCQGFL